jgi:hypothetical protein
MHLLSPSGRTPEQITQLLNEKFVFMEPIVTTVVHALFHAKNVLLHGPGGHAKSQIVEEALKLFLPDEAFYTDVYMANCSLEMDASPFVGYLNVKTLRDEGKHEMVLEDTIFLKNYFAVLEEGLDAPGYLLGALKDAIMRGYVCINGTCHPLKLKSLFICTNHNPVKWAGADESRKATIARFDFRPKVIWPSYTIDAFASFFEKVGSPDLLMAKVAGTCHEKGYFISPRDARKLKAAVDVAGSAVIPTFGDFEQYPDALNAVLEVLEQKQFHDDLKAADQLFQEAKSLMGDASKFSTEELSTAIAAARTAYVDLKDVPADAKYTGHIAKNLKALSFYSDKLDRRRLTSNKARL